MAKDLRMAIDDDFEFSTLGAQTDFVELSHTFEAIAQQYTPDSEEHIALIVGLMAFQYVRQQWGLEKFKRCLNNLDREPTVLEMAAYQIMGDDLNGQSSSNSHNTALWQTR